MKQDYIADSLYESLDNKGNQRPIHEPKKYHGLPLSPEHHELLLKIHDDPRFFNPNKDRIFEINYNAEKKRKESIFPATHFKTLDIIASIREPCVAYVDHGIVNDLFKEYQKEINKGKSSTRILDSILYLKKNQKNEYDKLCGKVETYVLPNNLSYEIHLYLTNIESIQQKTYTKAFLEAEAIQIKDIIGVKENEPWTYSRHFDLYFPTQITGLQLLQEKMEQDNFKIDLKKIRDEDPTGSKYHSKGIVSHIAALYALNKRGMKYTKKEKSETYLTALDIFNNSTRTNDSISSNERNETESREIHDLIYKYSYLPA